jgi:mRNA-degrading endonuclease RelE of RelBE toxin-antitoxin system
MGKSMTYKVEIAPHAATRMYDHITFLSKVSAAGAEKLLETLKKDLESLESTPFAHPYYSRFLADHHKYRYILSYSRYRIIYQIVNNMVYVDDIQDCRQAEDKNLIKAT